MRTTCKRVLFKMNNLFKFGPKGLVNVYYSSMLARRIESNQYRQMLLQLLCHAILQLKDATNAKKKQTYTGNNIWQIRTVEDVNFQSWEYDEKTDKMKEVKEHYCFTYFAYDLMYEGNLIFSMQEGYDGYEVKAVDFGALDECIDSILDMALKHAKMFGRMGE